MSRHPTTPMNEADLRLHLGKQTNKSIGLIDVVKLSRNAGTLTDESADVVLIDLLDDGQLAEVGRLIARSPFVVGSSGVESALLAHWRSEPKTFAPVEPAGPILAVCGSCSPVSARQVDWALGHGFTEVPLGATNARGDAICALRNRRSVVLHTRRGQPAGDALGAVVRDVLEATQTRRVLVAGGDTSGQVARALQIESLEMIGELARGSPLCRATAANSPTDGIEVTFKGGQIGPVDFFGMVEKGTAQHA
jgi:3-oxoisoapionate kinase